VREIGFYQREYRRTEAKELDSGKEKVIEEEEEGEEEMACLY